MFGVGFFEIFLISLVFLIFIGPKQLPEVMRHFGQFVRLCKQKYYQIKREVFDHPYQGETYTVKKDFGTYTSEGFAVPELLEEEDDSAPVQHKTKKTSIKKKNSVRSNKRSIKKKSSEDAVHQMYLIPDDGPFGKGTDMENEEDLFAYSKKKDREE